jgi:hypothetical protein
MSYSLQRLYNSPTAAILRLHRLLKKRKPVGKPEKGAAIVRDVNNGLTMKFNQSIHWLASLFVVIDAHRESNTNSPLAQLDNQTAQCVG